MDTDVCIGLERGDPDALAWFAQLTDPVAIPGFVAIEMLAVCRNTSDLRKVRTFLANFSRVWPSASDMERTVTDFAPLRLSHGLGGFDALIAATAIGQGAELFTRNICHLSAVPGLILTKPY